MSVRPRTARAFGRALAIVAILVAPVALGVLTAPPAQAHPLGNFTVNRYAGIEVRPGVLAVAYVVDLAEIPTFQARAEIDRDADGLLGPPELDAHAAGRCDAWAADLAVWVDGVRAALDPGASRLELLPGQAGLETTRIECAFEAPLPPWDEDRTIVVRDTNEPDRLGWREITARAVGTTLIRSDVPETSESRALRAYPEEGLRSPLDVREANLVARLGGDAAVAPAAPPTLGPPAIDRATAFLSDAIGSRRPSATLIAAAMLVALALGGLHALAPGHGKAVVAAYVTSGTARARPAVTIGLTVAATHTLGVSVLGSGIALSTALAPEHLYPWLGLASGLLIASVGVGLLRRALWIRRSAGAAPHRDGGHRHPHKHPAREDAGPPRLRSLVGLGFAGGLVPSPSALLLLLAALSLGRAWLGVALVVAYGLGMATVLSGISLLLLRARDRAVGWRGKRAARLATALPTVAALVVLAGGLLSMVRSAAAL